MKIDTITFTNIQEAASPLLLLAQNMLNIQHQITASLGASRKFEEAKVFMSKSNFLIASVIKAKTEEVLQQIRAAFISLCEKYKEI